MTASNPEESVCDPVDRLAEQVMSLAPPDRARMFKQVAALSRQRRARFQSSDPLLEMARRGRGLLTVREEQVLQLLVNGFANKEMATMLNLSTRTVELHRSRLMHKMLARNAADLCRIVTTLDREEVQFAA